MSYFGVDYFRKFLCRNIKLRMSNEFEKIFEIKNQYRKFGFFCKNVITLELLQIKVFNFINLD